MAVRKLAKWHEAAELLFIIYYLLSIRRLNLLNSR